MNSQARSNALGNERVFRIISYILVFLMLICVIMAASALLHNVIPAWPSGIMAGVMLLVLIDRLYTYPRFKSLVLFSGEWAATFGAQWVVLVIFVRLLLSYANGLDAFVTDMQLFAHGDLESFFSPEFVVTLFLAILAWYLPGQFLELLDEIGLDQAVALHDASIPVQSGVVPVQQRLVGLIFNLGIILVLVTALASLNLGAILSSSPGSFRVDPNRFSTGEAGVLLYFLFGLALLAQGRLISLQTRWNIQRIPISSDNLAKRWGLYSLLFLFLLILAVSLLPTGDSLGIFSTLGTLFGFLLSVVLFVGHLLVVIVAVLFSLPFLLFGRLPPIPFGLPPAPELPPPPVESPLGAGSSAAWILIRSILLWGSLILIIVFSLLHFIRQHDELLAALRKAPILHWLILAWEWLRRNVGRTKEGLSRALADGWQSIVARLEKRRLLPPAGWISLRALDPRRRIYFFYLAMLHHSDKQGLRRKPSQTPSEYAVTLERGLPSASEDIDSITQAFVEARYSRRAVNSGEADLVKAIWGRIRRALQNRFGTARPGKK
ncbi:MAG: DUF4129 domain-containing protein [Anaerolineales bacterium]|nr:DUF4129 domain-containing protein [Anaerolineales bacterium]